VNLFDLTSREEKGFVGRFDPTTYPVLVPDGTIQDNKQSWDKLCTDVMAASKKSGGCTLVSSSKNGTNRYQGTLSCYRSRSYRENSNKSRPKAGGEPRVSTFSRNKENARSDDGKKQVRRTSTSKAVPDSKETTCKAKVVIGVDAKSFFVICGLGKATHEGHPPLKNGEMPNRKRLIPEEAKAEAKRMANLGARPGLVSKTMERNFGNDLSRRQASELTKMAKVASDEAETKFLEENESRMSDQDRVLAHLNHVNASYVALLHKNGDCNPQLRPKKNQACNSSSDARGDLILQMVDQTGETTSVVEATGTNETNAEVMDYALEARDTVGAEENQSVIVALVWTLPEGRRMFQAFPEQLSVDGTHDTTDEEWDLLTLSLQDMNGQQETVLRCWAPNNRNWLFQWLFQTSVPTLMGAEACARTRLIICDGDPQECAQLDAAIKSVFSGAMRRRCGWHIVDRGMNRHINKNLGGANHKNKVAIRKFVQEVRNWLYSLMKDIETLHTTGPRQCYCSS